MADDLLPKEVAQLMAEQDQALDAELEAYASGRLSPEARQALLARSAVDPKLAEALELYAPLSEATQDRIAERSLAEVRTLPFRKAPIVGSLLALAAAIMIGIFAMTDRYAPLPSYAVNAQVQDALYRSEDLPRAPTVRSDSRIELVLVPDQPAEGALAGRLFLEEGTTVRVIAAAPEISPDGALRWRGTPAQLLGVETGTVTVVMVVGRPGQLPEAPDGLHADQQSKSVKLIVRPR
ncbi:MAG: hypothetical protein IPG45_38040 [Deltaproteobacteria bacterium]|nr:hypothetical protein [Deltaproteobacteria bacterium]